MTNGLEKAKKLTGPQVSLLRAMVGTGGKSGNFWLDLGHSIPALMALERRGLVEVVEYRGRPARSSYRRTPLGLMTLQSLDTGGGGA